MKSIWRIVPVFISMFLLSTLVGVAYAATIPHYAGEQSSVPVAFALNKWRVIPSANPSTSGDYLRGVAALAPNNIWAAGDYLSGLGKTQVDSTLIEHFDGSTWTMIPSPNPGTGPNGNYLRAIAAVSANNIYAAGSAGGLGTLIEHYDGSTWSVMSNPGIGVLQGITVISANNIWAVGDDGGPTKTLIEHFDGSSWSIVPSPNHQTGPGYYNELSAVSAVSASDIYAVGYYSTNNNPYQTLIEHFNGSKWSIIASPNAGTTHDYLSGVATISATNVYAVGNSFTLDSQGKALIEHFNGSKWNIVQSPSPGTLTALSSVAAASASSIYAVGYSFTGTPSINSVIEYYNGVKWSVVSSPNPGQENFLSGTVRVPGTSQFWAVGNEDGHTLAECNC